MVLGSLFAGIGGFVKLFMYLYIMANQYTLYPVPEKDLLENLYYGKIMTQTEIANHLGVSQKMVFSWFKKLNIKSRIATKRNQSGEKNHMWKGNDAGYAALHYRINNLRGKPSKCEYCKTTKAKRYEWANVNGNYNDPNDYVRLCASCHRKADNGTKNKIDIRGIV